MQLGACWTICHYSALLLRKETATLKNVYCASQILIVSESSRKMEDDLCRKNGKCAEVILEDFSFSDFDPSVAC